MNLIILICFIQLDVIATQTGKYHNKRRTKQKQNKRWRNVVYNIEIENENEI